MNKKSENRLARFYAATQPPHVDRQSIITIAAEVGITIKYDSIITMAVLESIEEKIKEKDDAG